MHDSRFVLIGLGWLCRCSEWLFRKELLLMKMRALVGHAPMFCRILQTSECLLGFCVNHAWPSPEVLQRGSLGLLECLQNRRHVAAVIVIIRKSLLVMFSLVLSPVQAVSRPKCIGQLAYTRSLQQICFRSWACTAQIRLYTHVSITICKEVFTCLDTACAHLV